MTELEKAIDKMLQELAELVSGNQAAIHNGNFLYTDARLRDDKAIAEAKQAILALIQDEVRKGRIDELKEFNYQLFSDDKDVDYEIIQDYLKDRIAQLSEGKE